MGGIAVKNHPFLLSALLTAVLAATSFILYVVTIFAPMAVLPHFHLSNVALLCLLALLVHRLVAPAGSVSPLNALFTALSFGLLPLCAGLVQPGFAVGLGLCGGAVMAVMGFLFRSAMERLRSSPATALAPPMTALLLYLCVQAFSSLWR